MNIDNRFIKVPMGMFESSQYKELKPSAKIVFVTACLTFTKYREQLKEGGWMFRPYRKLAFDSGLSPSAVYRGMKQLSEAGLIEIISGRNVHFDYKLCNEYRINGFKFWLYKDWISSNEQAK